MQHALHAQSAAPRHIVTLVTATLAVIALTFTAAAPAFAHDELTGQTFTESTDGAVTGILLSFSNDIMDVGTEILIENPSLESVTAGAPEVSGRDVTQLITSPLPVGSAYRATWRVVSSDGHPIQGAFFFEIAADGSAEVTAVGGTDPRFETGDSEAQNSAEAEGSPEAANTTDSAAATTTSAQNESSAFPAAGWIALVAVLALGAGGAVLFASRKRKQAAADATAPGVAPESLSHPHESDSAKK